VRVSLATLIAAAAWPVWQYRDTTFK